ncbi:MAG TPA: histidine kinase dimerization/phospho-acceptor domain-containing protein, partial [Thermoanaerobaculia bacterium]|nr:histidine kinase dimerization/phospho-acceptor domain-containing protein [Thermoanaerobaculia bacterium]
MDGEALTPGRAAALAPRATGRLATYTVVLLAGFTLMPWLRGLDWAGDPWWHTLHETVALMLAFGVALISLVRYYSRKTDTFLLLGTAFLGTALLDVYHAVSTSQLFVSEIPAMDPAAAGPWSWLASRIFLGLFLFWLSMPWSRPERSPLPLNEGAVYLLAGAVTLICFAFFTFTPLPRVYFPELLASRPAELIPAVFFLAALLARLIQGDWRESSFEHWLVLSLLLGFLGQAAFMPSCSRAFDAPFEAGHVAKSLSYLCVMVGLLSNVYRLFRRADESAADLARINAALQAEMDERTHAQQERDRFFEMSRDMLCIAGYDGYFKQINATWERLLGYTAEELMAKPFLEFVHPDDRTPTSTETHRLSHGGGTLDFENRYQAKDGTWRWLSWRSSVNEERELIYAVARDIQERKRVEQMKNDFVSVVSHELRTPLTSIRGSLGLVAGGVAGELPEKAQTLVEIAAKNCERLVRLINDILDVEKIESGTMGFRFAALELMPLVEQAVEINRAYAEELGVELRIAEPVDAARVWADADRLLQVMTNLLSNAAKFSPRDGTVEIAVRRGEAGRLRISVTDHG